MSSSTTKGCFNSSCREPSEKWWKGWRCRTGEYAHLCDRCAAAYEEGKFCETFHLNASGWRCCESCGKQIHCGCIVSFHMFVLLDAGGIECLTCAKKSYILSPNPAWPPPSQFLPSKPERMKDLSIKPWSALAGSGPVPWRQAPSVFNGCYFQSDAQPRIPSQIDVSVSGGIDRFRICERLVTVSSEMKQESSYERLVNGKPGFGPFQTLQNGFAGLSRKDHFYPSVNDFQPIFPKNDLSNFSLASASSCKTERDNPHAPTVSIQAQNHVCCHNGVDSSGEIQVHNGKPPRDGRGRNKMLRQYYPQITNEELQPIESTLKSVITPMFEKMLTASDAGRVGRLVLPKKCAEAYFPPIAHPEGVALKAQEMNGKEWVFQFRFWPNSNSRMYVLEGIIPCIQSMQLQAGDVVTFGRLEPEGKLVIGGRKASIIPSSDLGNDGTAITSGTSILMNDSSSIKSGDVIHVNCTMKSKPPNGMYPINQAARADIGTTPSEIDKCGFIAKNTRHPVSVIHNKRRNNGKLGAKSKRLKIENEDSLELNLTCKESQRLMRQPDATVPSVFVVEGWEFEDFEEAPPVIGRPTILWTDSFDEKIQWLQCEDCFKWRKVPADALLPSRWVCSSNVWDHDRSLCSAAEELAKEQLEDMLRATNKVSPEKETTEQDPSLFVALEGLDTLANLAIGDEGDITTKHPRHKPGCACIVCHQPPSGKSLKHEQSCNCVVCSSMKRRFKTLMDRREQKQLEKEAESASSQSLLLQQLPNNANKCSESPLKGQIDLNIKPDREEEFSPGAECVPMKRMLLSDAERFLRQQKSLSSGFIGNLNLVGKQMPLNEIDGLKFGTCVALKDCNEKTDHAKSPTSSI